MVLESLVLPLGCSLASGLSCSFLDNNCYLSSCVHLLPILEQVVAFTAKLAVEDSYPCHSGVLKFANVCINEGDAYNSETGIFTCPLDGLYHFMVHMSVYGRAQCAICKNSETVVSLYHTSLPDKCSQVASVSTVVKLAKSEQVWVSTWGPCRNDFFASPDNDSIFVGFRFG